jgi:hypothetical protein
VKAVLGDLDKVKRVAKLLCMVNSVPDFGQHPLVESMAFQGKCPKLAIVVDVQEVFSHCPKAFLRSKLWAVESQIDRRALPSFAEILRDHAALGECDLDELQRELDHRAASMLH